MKIIITESQYNLIQETAKPNPIVVTDPNDPRLIEYKKKIKIWTEENENTKYWVDYWKSRGYIEFDQFKADLKYKLESFGLKIGSNCWNQAYSFYINYLRDLKKDRKSYFKDVGLDSWDKYPFYRPHNYILLLEPLNFNDHPSQTDKWKGSWEFNVPSKHTCKKSKPYSTLDTFAQHVAYWKKPDEVILKLPKPEVTTTTTTFVPTTTTTTTKNITPKPNENVKYAYRSQTIINADGTREIKRVPYQKSIDNKKWVDVDAPIVIDYRSREKKYHGGKVEKF